MSLVSFSGVKDYVSPRRHLGGILAVLAAVAAVLAPTGGAGAQQPPSYSVSLSKSSVVEGDSGHQNVTVRFAATPPRLSGSYSFNICFGGTAAYGTDYTVRSGTGTTEINLNEMGCFSRSIPSSVPFFILVRVFGDTVEESNESVVVTLTSGGEGIVGTGTAMLTITDDDAQPLAPAPLVDVSYGHMHGTTEVAHEFWHSHSDGHTHHDNGASAHGGGLHKHVATTIRSRVLEPVRGASGGHSYMVTVQQQPAVGQILTVGFGVEHANVAGSVSVSPKRLEITRANWQQSHTITVTASADAEPGDYFVVRHWFSRGFADPYIAAYERFGLLWASIPRFDVTGRVSDAPVVQGAPPVLPSVSVSGAVSGEEGTPAVFTLTASPQPTAPLAVTLHLAQDGDYAAAGVVGQRTVVIPVAGTARVSVATVDDDADEPDGSVTLAVRAGLGYTLGTPASVSAPVLDNDDPPAVDDEAPSVQQQQQQPGAQDDAEPGEPEAEEEAGPQCDSDPELLATVEGKIVRHSIITGRADLVIEFTAVRDAMAGDGPLSAARGFADRRDGANALWSQIAAHLRDNCRSS